MRKIRWAAALAVLLLLCGCSGIDTEAAPTATVDPHAGMVRVDSGYGAKIWVKKYEDVDVNPLREVHVTQVEEVIDENGVQYDLLNGIDVSEHQGQIDWAALAASEERPAFVILRAGYRGYGEEGRLCTDAWFDENVSGARENGIPMGVYFFSQAVNEEEAVEEAEFLLQLLNGHDPEEFSLPIFFDWEEISGQTARTDGVDGKTLTSCALAFCRTLESAGYVPGIYSYRSLSYFRYDLAAIADYPMWMGALGSCPDYYYTFAIWQRSTTGTLPGIEGNVDLDVIFVAREAGETTTEPAPEAPLA